MIENLRKFEKIKMEKIANFTFLKNQLFRFLIISLVIFKEDTMHQNKAEDILSRPNFLTFIATIDIQ